MSELHITIGPVQSFVGASRRTRDLWAGSYLLSYLAGHAIAVVQEHDGEISNLDVGKNKLLAWIKNEQKNQAQPPSIGSLPNRFSAKVKNPPAVAREVVKGVESAWNKISNAVYEKYIRDAENMGEQTRKIWQRQVDNFWQISWIAGEEKGLLVRRKNWRDYRPPVEVGSKCTLMGEWQEISGYTRSKSSRERENQDNFWEKIRSKTSELDLRENERLCAISFIKRFYPKTDALGWKLEDTVNWPSTTHIAAVHWMKEALDTSSEACRAFASVAKKTADNALAEKQSNINCLDPYKREDFVSLDSRLFYYESKDEVKEDRRIKEEKADDFWTSLNDLRKKEKIGNPAPFYSLLVMDGDSMGNLLQQNSDRQGEISRGLSEFTEKVPEIVSEHNGVCLYAGGDDVLAMLPVEDGIKCASELAGVYPAAFPGNIEGNPTLSGGLVFSHFKTPLMAVLEEGHYLLDDIAKEKNGRNSLAVSVIKGSGKSLEWVAPWPVVRGEFPGNMEPNPVQSVAEYLASDDLSSSFVYNLRANLGRLFNLDLYKPGSFGDIISGLDLEGLIRSELAGAASHRSKSDKNKIIKIAKLLDKLSYSYTWDPGDGGPGQIKSNKEKFGIDAIMLARFLSQRGEISQ